MIGTLKKRKGKQILHTLKFLRCHSLNKQRAEIERFLELLCSLARRSLCSFKENWLVENICQPASGLYITSVLGDCISCRLKVRWQL